MKKLLIILIFSLCFAANARPASEAEQQGIINEQNRLMQRNVQFENEAIREKYLEKSQEDKKEVESYDEESELEEEAGKVVQGLGSLRCFRVNQIEFSQNKILPKSQEQIFLDENVKRCLTLRQISKITKEISDYLNEEGYVTSSAQVNTQELAKGRLKINVVENYLEDLVFGEDKFFDKTQRFTAFGKIKKGEILNIKKIERSLEVVKNLHSSDVKIKILPGKKENHSIVFVTNNSQKVLRTNLVVDNYGNKLTGSRRQTIGFEKDNLFYLNDRFSLQRVANDLDSSRKKNGGSEVLTTNWSLPFKSYTLNLGYSNSSYFFWGGTSSRLKSSGETSSRMIGLEKVLIKNHHLKIAPSLEFLNRHNRNFIDDIKTESSSRKASIASFLLPTTFFFKDSVLFLKPSYSKGLGILDAKEDGKNLDANANHAEFNILRFYANYSLDKKFFETPVSYKINFSSQFSDKKLYGIDQFSVGGINSVRGFAEGTISGDSGYNLKNEIVLKFRQLTAAPFYDYGYVESKVNNGSGRLSGAGLKLGFKYKNFNSSVVFSRAVTKSRLLKNHYRENGAVFFNLSSEIGFF